MDDSLNIARANLLSYQYPLELSTYLVKEFDYIPWQASLEAFSYIDLMFVRTGGYGNFKVSVLNHRSSYSLTEYLIHSWNAALHGKPHHAAV